MRITVETIVYLYMTVCIAVILFYCAFAFWQTIDGRHAGRYSARCGKQMREQTERMKKGMPADSRYFHRLGGSLRRLSNLMAFSNGAEDLYRMDEEGAELFLRECMPAFGELARRFRGRRDPVGKALLAYVVSRHGIFRTAPSAAVTDALFSFLREESLYCRQNASLAVYSFGNPGLAAKALKIINERYEFFHPKLLTDGLLTYAGDHGELIGLLLSRLEEFEETVQVAILNYIRLESGDYGRELYPLLADPSVSREIHFALIRYFGSHAYEPARPKLMSFLEMEDGGDWEYPAIAASSLASYPGEETKEALKHSLHSVHWYVRHNSAKSLFAIGVTYQEITDVLNGEDRFAREMLLYFIQQRAVRVRKDSEEKGGKTA